ncbi:MAG: hypothetical protein AABY55_06955 [Candidatus Omnitrophota bacterium]
MTNTVYAIEICKENYLRKPLIANQEYEIQRLKDAIGILSSNNELNQDINRRNVLITAVLTAAFYPMLLFGEANRSIVPDKDSIWRIVLDIVDELAAQLKIDSASTEKIKADLYKEAEDALNKYSKSMPWLLRQIIGTDFTKPVPKFFRSMVRSYIRNKLKPTIQKYAMWAWKLEPAEMRILIQEYDLTKIQVSSLVIRALRTKKEEFTIEEAAKEAGEIFAFIIHLNFIREGAEWYEDSASEFCARLEELNQKVDAKYTWSPRAEIKKSGIEDRPAGFVNKNAQRNFFDDIGEIYAMLKLKPEELKNIARKDTILRQKIALLNDYLNRLKSLYSVDILPKDLKVEIKKGEGHNKVNIHITHLPAKITIKRIGIEINSPNEIYIEKAIAMASLRRELYKRKENGNANKAEPNQSLKESIPADVMGTYL